MILMWLGSFVLMLFGLQESQKALSAYLANLQKAFWDKGLDATFGQMLVRALDVVILEASPSKTLYSGMALRNLKVLGLRSSILVMCLSILGGWWALLLGLLFLSFNGFFLLGLCVIVFFNFGATAKLRHLLRLIFASGVFLIGGEMMLRNSSVIQTLLGQSDFAFMLADGRFGAVLGLLAISMVLSLFVQVEFWSMALGLSLLVTNVLSFNGALALVAGERAGRMLLFWWQTRNLDQECRRLGAQLSGVSIAGVLFGFGVAGELRNLFYLGFSSDLTVVQDKSLQFVFMLVVILFFQFVAQMAWGHFAAKAQAEEIAEAKYLPVSWVTQDMMSPIAWVWAKEKVQKRLSEIRYHLQGLGTLKEGQVPETVQSRLKDEEQQLSQLMKADWT